MDQGEEEYPKGKPTKLKDEADDAVCRCLGIPRSDMVVFCDEVGRAKGLEVQTMPCKVEKIDQMSHDVIHLLLKQPEDQRIQFMAGQYLNILLSDGSKRAFSMANAPHDDEFIELHIRHVPGGGYTDYVFKEMHEKDSIQIEAPLGTFTLQEKSDRPIIFVAGGTGFAPIKGIIEHALHIGDIRPIHIYWGVRSKRDLYMDQLPRAWEKGHGNVSYTPVLSEPDSDWTGRTGWVHEAVLEDNPGMSGFDVYMAGPPVMVKAGRDAFADAGLAQDRMFYDAFEYAKK